LIRWAQAHPMNRSYITSILVFLTWSIVIFTFGRSLDANYPRYHKNHMTGQMETEALWTALSCGAIFVGLLYVVAATNEQRMKTHYRRYAIWSRSPLMFVAMDLMQMTYLALGTFAIIGVGIVSLMWGMLFGFASVFVCGLAAAVLHALLSFGKMTLKSAHWVGVITTLSVTIITAYLTRGSRTEITVWMLAFTNGTVCGLASAGIYHLCRVARNLPKLVAFSKADHFEKMEVGVNFVAKIGMPILRKFIQPVVIDFS
jgi:hypothetical protein